MFIGNLLAHAAMLEGRKVTYLPVYGVEMRGGTANCTIVISDKDIGSPSTNNPTASLVMNKPSLVKFGPMTKTDGLILVNSSLIKPEEVEVTGPEILLVPAVQLAADAGNDRLSNMVMLGALAGKTEVVTLDSLNKALEETSSEASEEVMGINQQAMALGYKLGAGA